MVAVAGWVRFFVAAVVTAAALSQPLKTLLPFYHSTDELQALLVEAAHGCKTATVTLQTRQAGNVSLVVVSLAQLGNSSVSPKKRQKALFVYGEHARELVSSESGVHLVRSLCGLGSLSADRAREALASTDFVVVPNANPVGRRLVESGAFCQRTNENGVDLNRNWGDDHRDQLVANTASAGTSNDEENPGRKGFSEPETQILQKLAEEVSPDLFLSVHSGAYLLGMPFGFSSKKKPMHAEEMMQMLGFISERYCHGQCPYGTLAATIGYDAPGCSIDYVTQRLNVSFAFTWEIYTDAEHLAKFAADSRENAADIKDPTNSWNTFATRFLKVGLLRQAAHLKDHAHAKVSKVRSCLTRFNPQNESTLNSVLQTWTEAYLDLAMQAIAVRERSGIYAGLQISSREETGDSHAASHQVNVLEHQDAMQQRRTTLTKFPAQEVYSPSIRGRRRQLH